MEINLAPEKDSGNNIWYETLYFMFALFSFSIAYILRLIEQSYILDNNVLQFGYH